MNIGFVINDLETEHEKYTTVHFAVAATNAGHEAWLIGARDFGYAVEGTLYVRARAAPGKKYRTTASYLMALRGDNARVERIGAKNLDVIMLRSDPAADAERPWAQSVGFIFGQLAEREGVLVVNDPGSLAEAFNKLYFQHFPDSVRPRTVITCDLEEISAFVKREKGRAVLKPLQGSGGTNVFVMKSGDKSNLNQMVEAISRDGYVIAQEYLPAAKDGDVRLFVMNGEPLTVNGKVAAFQRKPAAGDSRSNMSVGGTAARVEVTEDMLRIVETVRPKLLCDGMFLVGLDIVGDKLMEVNVFSPGGLHTCEALMEENFSRAVIAALERKIAYREHYGTSVGNKRLATM